MRRLAVLLCAMAALAMAPRVGAAALLAEYHLGEAGSLGTNNLPLDTSGGGNNFQNTFGGGTSVVAPGAGGAPGSTAALQFNNAGFYGIPNTLALSGNFQVDLWANPTAGTSQTALFTSGNDGSDFRMSIVTDPNSASGYSYAASYGNTQTTLIGTSQIGASGEAAMGSWSHLEILSVGGLSSFFINGLQQGGTVASPGTIQGQAYHIGVTPGGATAFTGVLDEATISTVVPEPSSLVLIGVGAVGLLLAARRRRSA